MLALQSTCSFSDHLRVYDAEKTMIKISGTFKSLNILNTSSWSVEVRLILFLGFLTHGVTWRMIIIRGSRVEITRD